MRKYHVTNLMVEKLCTDAGLSPNDREDVMKQFHAFDGDSNSTYRKLNPTELNTLIATVCKKSKYTL